MQLQVTGSNSLLRCAKIHPYIHDTVNSFLVNCSSDENLYCMKCRSTGRSRWGESLSGYFNDIRGMSRFRSTCSRRRSTCGSRCRSRSTTRQCPAPRWRRLRPRRSRTSNGLTRSTRSYTSSPKILCSKGNLV